ncbi:MAG TPA: hypothetical protein VFZ26_09105 [Gemmatimonadales bacterium]
MRRLAPLLVLLLLGGCVYYNGMYNTKRLAGSARRAEREGRTFEANNLWGQVITRAESLVVRHPRSKYVDQALVFKGIALARLGQCPAAVTPLARASVLELEGEVAEEASLALGRCQMELGDAALAEHAFRRVAQSDDADRRREAELYFARALRLTGRPEEALAALEGLDDPKVPGERLLALAAAGRSEQALALADSMLARNDSARTWDSLLVAVGRSNPPLASVLVDRLGGRASTPPALHAKRLLEDADRLGPVDSARAAERLRQTAIAGAGTAVGEQAQMRLARLQGTRTITPQDLGLLLDTLNRIAKDGAGVRAEALLLAATVTRVRAAADSGGPGTPQGDLRLFLAAETARDTLGSRALAASLFRQLVETWPDSPYAPKALLAGQSLDSAWGEQSRGLLTERYSASPYLAFVRGEEPVGYRELEDSLRSYALSLAAGQARRRPTPGVRRADDPDLPETRRRPGGRRPRVPSELDP